MIRIEKATLDDALYVAKHLRPGDKCELERAGHTDFTLALRQSVEISPFAFTAFREKDPLCVFGLLPDGIISQRAKVWLLGTEDLNKIKKSFIITARRVVGQMLELYPVLYNAVDAHYPQAKRLLNYLGAEMKEKVKSKTGAEFLIFEIRRNTYVHGK